MEGKIEYVLRQLEERTETLASISKGAKVSLRAIGYLLTSQESDSRGTSIKTINRLNQYFNQKGKL